jgi:hypothetical protein
MRRFTVGFFSVSSPSGGTAMRRRKAMNIWGRGCLVLCLFAGAVFTNGSAAQQRLVAPAADHDPIVGTWKVNPDKSHPRLTAKDVWCQWVLDRKGEPCTVAISREGDERVSKIVAVGLAPWKSVHNESRARCDGERHLLEDQSEPYQTQDVFRAGDAGELPGPIPAQSGSEQPSRSYRVCWYVTPNLVDGETGTDLHDPNKSGEGNAFFFGQVTYWREAVSPDGQEKTYTEYGDKKRTKIKRTLVYDRIN